MVKRHDVSHIPVQKVKPGFTLLMASSSGKPPWAIEVEEVGWNHTTGEKPTITITSSPHVATGEPVVLDALPLGTIVTRVLRTYDDGA
jgi:hypothetical protein